MNSFLRRNKPIWFFNYTICEICIRSLDLTTQVINEGSTPTNQNLPKKQKTLFLRKDAFLYLRPFPNSPSIFCLPPKLFPIDHHQTFQLPSGDKRGGQEHEAAVIGVENDA
jgi:hypothetical protein